MADPDTTLNRYIAAQDAVYEEVTAQLRAGRKTTHWMWFVFPQLKSLGRSSTAAFYGLVDGAEARAYWQHSTLGSRLAECTRLVLIHEQKSAHEIFGSPDDLKFKSCMTLFDRVAKDETIFGKAIDVFFGGERDMRTIALLDERY